MPLPPEYECLLLGRGTDPPDFTRALWLVART
jgi:hypothetical protein